MALAQVIAFSAITIRQCKMNTSIANHSSSHLPDEHFTLRCGRVKFTQKLGHAHK